MIRAVIWKELREQGLIAATLIVLGAGILIAAATLADPPSPGANPADVVRYLGAGRLGTLLLAVTAGMVCGGALFAAERESGTMGFLDSLPVSRWHLWIAKLAAGLLLTFTQIAFVLIAAAALGHVGTSGFAFAVAVYALLAFAWGTYGSTLSHTTLGSVGVAIPSASLACMVFLLPIMLVFARPGASWPRLEGGLLFLILMLVTPLVLSALSFTKRDRERAGDDLAARVWVAPPIGDDASRPLPPAAPQRGRPRYGLRALLWLGTRQIALIALAASGFALTAGLTLLLPTVLPLLAWPMLGLAAGVLAGVTTFFDEQGRGIARFWGERRLPIGRLWTVKVLMHFGFALWLAFVVLLPSSLRIALNPLALGARGHSLLSGVFRSLLFEELGGQGWKFVLLPVVYGFAAGHLCGMLFRKPVVAAGVAGLVGGTFAALWLPSLLAGGVWHWQVWLPPAAALVLARVSIRDWASERLFTRGPLLRLIGGTTAVLLIIAAGLGYRAVEVADDPQSERDVAFVSAFPEFDANLGGRDFRSAAERYARVAAKATADRDRPNATLPPTRFEDRLEAIIQDGWVNPHTQRIDDELVNWLDDLYTDAPAAPDERSWFEWAEVAASRPAGIFEDPRLYAGPAGLQPLENARRMALVILVRGLLLQERDGDHAAFVGSFRTAMQLAQSLRNRSIVPAAQVGFIVERSALFAAYQWMRHLPNPTASGRLRSAPLPIGFTLDRAALLAAWPQQSAPAARGFDRIEAAWLLQLVLASCLEADPHAVYDPTPHLLAQRYVVRGLMSAPNQWLPDMIAPPGKGKDAANVEADLVGFAWTVPWERERTRRLVGHVLADENRIVYGPTLRGRPGAQLLVAWGMAASDLTELDRVVRGVRRGLALVLAIRLWQLCSPDGESPAALEVLVRDRLIPAVPPDPYDGQPFRYRRSAGEDLTQVTRMGTGRAMNLPMSVRVHPGAPIIWCIGPDRTDQGGKQVPMMPAGYPRQEDWVFLLSP